MSQHLVVSRNASTWSNYCSSETRIQVHYATLGCCRQCPQASSEKGFHRRLMSLPPLRGHEFRRTSSP
jgi:hypothetical protein